MAPEGIPAENAGADEIPEHIRPYIECKHPAKSLIRDALAFVRHGWTRERAGEWLRRMAPGEFETGADAEKAMEAHADILEPIPRDSL